MAVFWHVNLRFLGLVGDCLRHLIIQSQHARLWLIWCSVCSRGQINDYAMLGKKVTAQNDWVDKCSTTTKVCSVTRSPKVTFNVVLPTGFRFRPSALINFTAPMGLRWSERANPSHRTEHVVPVSSSILTSLSPCLPTTKAALAFPSVSAGTCSTAFSSSRGHPGASGCPPGRFPSWGSSFSHVLWLRTQNVPHQFLCGIGRIGPGDPVCHT